MEPRSSLVELLTSDETTVGTVLKSVSLNVTEALGYSPLDFLFVDRQHGSPVVETLENIVRVADLQDTPVVVRVPRNDTSEITPLLDHGVRGIMLPQVESPQIVKEASSHIRYEDGRSLGSTTRAARFGQVPKSRYAEYVNDELALLPMIETRAGLENVEQIAQMEEVTAIAIGPGDLSWSLDTTPGTETFTEAINKIFEAATKNDCPVGIFVSTQEELEQYSQRAAFAIYGSDIGFLLSHYKTALGDK